MAGFDTSCIELGFMDQLSLGNSSVHRLDPRSKVLVTLGFIVTILSFGKYEIAPLIPFFTFPLVMVFWAELPLGYLLKRMIWVAPFVVLIGIFNPILDRTIMVVLGPLRISAGWISYASLLLRFVLAVGASLILLASTGIHGVCFALEKMGVPRVFTVQVLFLHRYLFQLVHEVGRLLRARAVRSFGRQGFSLAVFGSMTGHLLLRTLDQSDRIHRAMRCRGFDGHIHTTHHYRFTSHDLFFMAGWFTFFICLRFVNVSRITGQWILEVCT